jgi:DNA primase
MILVEGYTDVLALHQAGLSNAVGIMGTSFTEEQLRELSRVVTVLELCLDADQAGQAAMVRAAKMASERKPPLELRVVALPQGADPADLVEREGADALRGRVEQSQPFVVFHVERILDRGDLRSAEGRDAAFAELQPVLAEVPPSALRDELMRKVSGRLELPEARLATLVAAGADGTAAPGGLRPAATRTVGGNGRNGVGLSQELKTERAFLALCIALPDAGDEALGEIVVDELLTSDAFRRAARHLAGRCRTPLADLPPEDDELARTLADLVERAGRGEDITIDRLHHARLLLELARLDRAIVRARAQGGESVSDLARERQETLDAYHHVVARLERAV